MTTNITAILLLLSLLITSPLLFAQDPDQESEPAAPATSTATGTEDLLDQQVPNHEKIWLNSTGGPQLAFYLNETSGKAYGGVLLIPDTNRHPATAGLLNSLRHSLARNHWHTLAIKVADANDEQTQQLITAGISQMNQRGIYNLAILGEGAGAAQALAYVASTPASQLNQNQSNQIRAVLLIDGSNQVPNSDLKVLAQLAEIKIPILDAFLSNNYQEQQQAAKRKQAARRHMNKLYQQIRLPQVSNFDPKEDNRITKRIRGWLDNNVAGFMVDR
ncbi:DUF3530 family protein [Oceanicoccus sp. KOV_DT_Chl]|uniref:DUF3530 family protein n=1 Tax=Oceanicoccus sp. KOV_DT_Chl TaxID=1904639 RepID=UPI000C7CA409|nr:DUF3530 family protein [Oceanicoccus sp. KOV_DT_Chl]